MDEKFNNLLEYINNVSNQNKISYKKNKGKQILSFVISIIAIILLVSSGYFLKTVFDNKKDLDNSYKVKNELINSSIKNNLVDFNSLKEKNKDTIGWLIIKDTVIDYPVVQSFDNEYYLKRDFYGRDNVYGWIFADSRNTFPNLLQNTIIYGHNTSSGIMFGDLIKLLDETWYQDEEHKYINFSTEKENYKFEIFSVYRVTSTNDYLDVTFGSNFGEYINLVKNRSFYDFGVEVSDEKILTLSTCYDVQSSSVKLVVHAKLVD